MVAVAAVIASAPTETRPEFDYTLAGGTFGADYKVDPNIRIGGALNYTNPIANLHGGTGHLNLDSYQVGGLRPSPTRIC